MTDDRYIHGVPCWVDLTPPDVDAAVAFYGELFGWTFDEQDVPEGRYTIASRPSGVVAAIGTPPRGLEPRAGWRTYIRVDDADAVVKAVRAAGGEVLVEAQDAGEAGRMAVVADAEGAEFAIWQAGTTTGAPVVNEHGSVNFNDLHSQDHEAAKAFYGQVFGWDVLPLGGMWTLPAYGDFLEARQPGFKAQMESMGAPERFDEVVASLQQAAPGEPASWGVTFAVDDADAIVAAARGLGATVLAGPFDAPWTRMAVLQDPQGTPFLVGQFVPENKDVEAPQAATA